MTETLFKIGSVYRDGKGRVMKLIPYGDDKKHDWAIVVQEISHGCFPDNAWQGDGARRLSDGRYVHDHRYDRDDIALIPGELELRAGQWIAKEDKPMAPYFAEAVEDKTLVEIYEQYEPDAEALALAAKAIEALNARMIARDGPAKPAPAAVVTPPASTAHPALASLTRFTAVDHRLGSAYR